MELQSPEDIRNKKVLIMGLGLHRGGLMAAKWFSRHGAHVTVTDMKNEEQLSRSIDELRSYPDIIYHLGGHRFEDFSTHDLIIQNPAVPPSSPYLVQARAHNIRIENELSFFFLMTKGVCKIAVTGTRGKSTTTTLISEVLKKKYRSVYCAGVALGKGTQSFFDILDPVCHDKYSGLLPICVMECSSFQLELLNEHTGGPDYAIITNIYQDHLNRYTTLQSYIDAKRTIYKFQSHNQCLIVNYDNNETRKIGMDVIPGKRLWFSRINQKIDGASSDIHPDTRTKWFVIRNGESVSWICPLALLKLKGDHNIENALSACVVTQLLGVESSLFGEAISSFSGVAFRQEYGGIIQGRVVINDTTATSPDGLIAALNVFEKEYSGKIVLLAGGNDKQLDFTQCAKRIRDTVKKVILFEGTATQKFCDALDVQHVSYTRGITSMERWVEEAFAQSEPGDCILLSPACASFGIFEHEFDRGEQFNVYIKQQA